MTKKVLIFIIVFIVFYELYVLYSEKSSKELGENNTANEQKITPIDNILHAKFEDHVELVENVDINMFGEPSQYEKNNIIVWTMLNPNPWNKVIYKYNEKYPFYFYIKIKVPSLNDYSNWKKIIPNLDFDPRSGEIIIPTEDEETALSIANLIISNFRGNLSLEDIINKNLIDVSINKAKKYEVVKNKLIEQIMTNLNEKIKESFDDTQTFATDLAKKHDEYTAYEGTEYSFF